METPLDSITVYAEMTPNPSTMKFVSSIQLVDDNEAIEIRTPEEAKSISPLAEALFQFPFVDSVFIMANFVSVTKIPNVEWDFITMRLRQFVRSWLREGKKVFNAPSAEITSQQKKEKNREVIPPSELDEQIKALLNDYVRPTVENDGGAIEYVGYEHGLVTVELKGSCSGCPSSTATLRGGIEQLLKGQIPEVKAVVALGT